ncbi:hypothetical protein AC1031_010969 [Aphanomyces cochlioides]|nr:hypothetical protein AC1031_010969 [Aphanomyces cochlioides]
MKKVRAKVRRVEQKMLVNIPKKKSKTAKRKAREEMIQMTKEAKEKHPSVIDQSRNAEQVESNWTKGMPKRDGPAPNNCWPELLQPAQRENDREGQRDRSNGRSSRNNRPSRNERHDLDPAVHLDNGEDDDLDLEDHQDSSVTDDPDHEAHQVPYRADDLDLSVHECSNVASALVRAPVRAVHVSSS